jgi:hypothetical protein
MPASALFSKAVRHHCAPWFLRFGLLQYPGVRKSLKHGFVCKQAMLLIGLCFCWPLSVPAATGLPCRSPFLSQRQRERLERERGAEEAEGDSEEDDGGERKAIRWLFVCDVKLV